MDCDADMGCGVGVLGTARLAKRLGSTTRTGLGRGLGRERNHDPVEVPRKLTTPAPGSVVIALVTDSNSQLTPTIESRFDVIVVPLSVTVDGRIYRERVDLSAEQFFGFLAAGAVVSSAAPSPGAFAEAYRTAADRGANAIVSIHLGSQLSATVDAARLGARESPIPVTVVDTQSASFAVALSVWAAGDALARDGGAEQAVGAASRVAAATRNVFVAGALDLARQGGRLRAAVDDAHGVPLLAVDAAGMHQVGVARSIETAADGIAAYVGRQAGRAAIRAAVGDADAPELADAIALRLGDQAVIADLVRYEVGPSVAAHTGTGTAGVVFHPLDVIE